MDIGIVGLPNAGKSSLFNALTAAGIPAANFPFTTIDPNVGIVPVPDPRLEQLQKIFNAPKTVAAAVRFVDIAGLVPGASKNEGMGNKFLSHIRDVDAIVHVIRCFVAKDVVNILGEVSPRRDVEVITTELLLADLEQAEKAKERLAGAARTGQEEAKKKTAVLDAVLEGIRQGVPVRQQAGLDPALIAEFNFLTAKPVLYLANIDDDTPPELVQEVRHWAKENNAGVVELNVKIEAEIMEMSDDERASFRDALGIKDTGLGRLARAGQKLLDLITFFAAGPKEVHAWHLKRGATVAQAAGKIHSDMEKGFIRAEVYAADELVAAGSEETLRAKGRIRMEGRDYVTQDGDVLQIHFKV